MGQCTKAAKAVAKARNGTVAAVRVEVPTGPRSATMLLFRGSGPKGYSCHNVAIVDGKVVDLILYPSEPLSKQDYATRLVNDVFREQRTTYVIFQLNNNAGFVEGAPGVVFIYEKGEFTGEGKHCLIM